MKEKISSKTVVIIVLIGIIISLIFIILNIKNNNIIQQEVIKEQLGGTTDNAYVEIQTHLSEVSKQEEKLLSFKSEIANAITEKGIETSEDADATTMASNIRSIAKTSEVTIPFSSNSCTVNNYSSTSTEATYKWDFIFKEVNVTKFKYSTSMYSTEGWKNAMVIYVRDSNNNVLGTLQGYSTGEQSGTYICTGEEDHIYIWVGPYHSESRYTSIIISEITVEGTK